MQMTQFGDEQRSVFASVFVIFRCGAISGGTEATNDGENSPSNAIICRDRIIPEKNKALVKFIPSRDWTGFDK